MSVSAGRRRFTLLDAMILMAALAGGFALTRWIEEQTYGNFSWLVLFVDSVGLSIDVARGDWDGLGDRIVELGLVATCLTATFVAPLTFAMLPIRLVPPRPRFRRLLHQPGMMASGAVTMTAVLFGLLQLVEVLVAYMGRRSGVSVCEDLMPIFPAVAGLAVLTSWLTLIIGRRWRSEPSWIDKVARKIGAYWIISGLLLPLLLILRSPGSHCEVRVVVPPWVSTDETIIDRHQSGQSGSSSATQTGVAPLPLGQSLPQ